MPFRGRLSCSPLQVANFFDLNKERVLYCIPSLCKCWNSYKDLAAGFAKSVEKRGDFLDLEEIIHGCSSEERSHHELWQVCSSENVAASLKLGTPSTDTIKNWRMAHHRAQRGTEEPPSRFTALKFVLRARQSDLKFKFSGFLSLNIKPGSFKIHFSCL